MRELSATRGKIGAQRRARIGALLLSLSCLALAISACDTASKAPVQTGFGGNSERGARLIAAEGCGACHTISGINGANGLVGPPLNNIGRRSIIAGLLPNTPDNMIGWLRDPQKIIPGNAMPDMGLDHRDARDIAAYLYTLRD